MERRREDRLGQKADLPQKVPGLSARPKKVIIIRERYDFMTGYRIRLRV